MYSIINQTYNSTTQSAVTTLYVCMYVCTVCMYCRYSTLLYLVSPRENDAWNFCCERHHHDRQCGLGWAGLGWGGGLYLGAVSGGWAGEGKGKGEGEGEGGEDRYSALLYVSTYYIHIVYLHTYLPTNLSAEKGKKRRKKKKKKNKKKTKEREGGGREGETSSPAYDTLHTEYIGTYHIISYHIIQRTYSTVEYSTYIHMIQR